MIPQKNKEFVLNEDLKEMPSYTYEIDFKKDKITGNIDKIPAMEQAIYKIINTERYQYLIYTWNYGIELQDLIGKSTNYCVPEIERRITEALLWDSRIKRVFDFEFNLSRKKCILVTFTVQTIFGNIKAERQVSI